VDTVGIGVKRTCKAPVSDWVKEGMWGGVKTEWGDYKKAKRGHGRDMVAVKKLQEGRKGRQETTG